MNKSELAKRVRKGLKGKGKLSLAWKGGRRINWAGYVMITINGKEVREHRYLMEKKLGRKLRKNESVHHINGIRTDNRLKNLIVMKKSEHDREHTLGIKNPFYGKKHTLESRTKIKEARKKQVGINHPMFGKHHSEKTKNKISETKRRNYESRSIK